MFRKSKEASLENNARTLETDRGMIDVPYLVLTVLLVVIGLIMLFSASYARAYYKTGNSARYFISQLLFAIMGMGALFLFSRIPYEWYQKLSLLILAVSVILLALVPLIGTRVGGAKRWISLGFTQFQPSEIAKFAVIVSFAAIMAAHTRDMKTFKYGFAPYMLILGVIAVLLYLEPHMSATLIILALGFMGNMVQSNSIGDAFHNAFGLNRLAVGVVVAAIAAFIFLGGVQRIAAVTEKVVPIMAAFYILGCIAILVINAKALPGALAQVFVLAFEPQAMAGGIAGVTVQQSMRFGVARGLFSNEAGLGSTPHAHALAKVERPQDQGAVAILGVFVDTFVVLTLTGLVLITSGLIPQGMTGTVLTQAAFSQAFGGFGPIFIAVCMFFFAFSTIIGWYFFGQSNFKALFGEKLLPVYSIIVVAFILVGSTLKVDLVWALADLFNGLMAVPNLLALLALAGVVVAIDRK